MLLQKKKVWTTSQLCPKIAHQYVRSVLDKALAGNVD